MYEICKDTFRKFKKDPKTNYFVLDMQSAYLSTAKMVLEICNFLVRINNNMPRVEASFEQDENKNASNSIKDLEENNAPLPKPLPFTRSFSSAPESQIGDAKIKKNLQHLRELVDTY